MFFSSSSFSLSSPSEWSSFRILKRVPKVDAAVMVIVSAVTVWKDLAAAVGAGVVLSALNYAWKSSQQIYAEKDETTKEGYVAVFI
jgi:MFS superfamily sulfate permease-like transporter